MPTRTQTTLVLVFAGAVLLACILGIMLRPAHQAELSSTVPVTCRIDPNLADAQTLCLLPRIGPGIAQRLIDDRNTNGPFQNAADMARVPMVGEKTVEALRPWLLFSSTEQP